MIDDEPKATPCTEAEIKLMDAFITLLPDDEQQALNLLASLTEAVVHSIGEPLETFYERLKAWERARP